MRRQIRAFAAVLALVLAAGIPAAAGDRDDLSEKLKENSSRLEKLRSQLEGVDTSLQQTYLNLEAKKQELQVAEGELAKRVLELQASQRKQRQLADRLAIAEAELNGLAGEISRANEKIKISQASLGELARTTYQNGGTAHANPMSLLFGSTSSRDFLTTYTALDTAVRTQSAVLDKMSALEATTRNAKARQDAVTARIGELKAQADQAVSDATAAKSAADAKRTEIAGIRTNLQALAGALEGQKAKIVESQRAMESDAADLKARIAKIDEENRREEERRARENRPKPPAPAPPRPGSSAFVPPVPRPLWVTSPYGYRVYPITGGWFMHHGVDLSSGCGNTQVATAAGTVTATRPAYGNGTHGNQVIINHGYINGRSTVSVYNHLSSFAVRPGQSVHQGQPIGYTGATGRVTGCHVHFEVWFNGSSVDPMRLF